MQLVGKPMPVFLLLLLLPSCLHGHSLFSSSSSSKGLVFFSISVPFSRAGIGRQRSAILHGNTRACTSLLLPPLLHKRKGVGLVVFLFRHI